MARLMRNGLCWTPFATDEGIPRQHFFIVISIVLGLGVMLMMLCVYRDWQPIKKDDKSYYQCLCLAALVTAGQGFPIKQQKIPIKPSDVKYSSTMNAFDNTLKSR